MSKFDYVHDFISIARKDYDELYSFSSELAHHFERCVGVNREKDESAYKRYCFVYDPQWGLSEQEFRISVDFVKANMPSFCQKMWYQNHWANIMQELESDEAYFVFSNTPVSFVFEHTYDKLNLVPLYDYITLGGSRRYGLTSRGKLVPLSHSSLYVETPYTQQCYTMIQKMVDKLSAYRETMIVNDINVFSSKMARFEVKNKAEFEERYPEGNVKVLQESHQGFTIAYVASAKGGIYRDIDGIRLYGSLYEFEDKMDLDRINKEYAANLSKYEKAIKKMSEEEGMIRAAMAKCRREHRAVY